MAVHRAWHGNTRWDWEAFYPLRTILIAILALNLLVAQGITVAEGFKLIRHSLHPGRLLVMELSKTPIWLLWSTVVGLSFFNIIEKEDSTLTFGILLLAIHNLGFLVLLIPVPYAAAMWIRDRRGYYGVRNSSGWGYEDGQWVKPEQPAEIIAIGAEDADDTNDDEAEDEEVGDDTTEPDTDEAEDADEGPGEAEELRAEATKPPAKTAT
ncbi:Hypothetical protein D9617_17g047820 [Elsinoe fawcettii]|nr:Hypothetical protein D9617_17g047820 [Elsinoe fawcettii]